MRVPGDILFQAGTHCEAVRMGFEDWFQMVNPRVGSFSEPVSAWPGKSALDKQSWEWEGGAVT